MYALHKGQCGSSRCGGRDGISDQGVRAWENGILERWSDGETGVGVVGNDSKPVFSSSYRVLSFSRVVVGLGCAAGLATRTHCKMQQGAGLRRQDAGDGLG